MTLYLGWRDPRYFDGVIPVGALTSEPGPGGRPFQVFRYLRGLLRARKHAWPGIFGMPDERQIYGYPHGPPAIFSRRVMYRRRSDRPAYLAALGLPETSGWGSELARSGHTFEGPWAIFPPPVAEPEGWTMRVFARRDDRSPLLPEVELPDFVGAILPGPYRTTLERVTLEAPRSIQVLCRVVSQATPLDLTADDYLPLVSPDRDPWREIARLRAALEAHGGLAGVEEG